MTTQQHTVESHWTNINTEKLITESEVPTKATQLASSIDNWFANNKEFIDPFNWDQADKDYFRLKSFLELSGYLLNAKGVAGEQPLPEIQELIFDRVNDKKFGHTLLRSPRKLHYFYLPVVYTAYFDELQDETEVYFERCIELGSYWEVERVNYRQQEYCFIFKLLSQLFGCEQDVYNDDEALNNSLLDNQPNIIRSNLPDAYCLTHDVIFYNNHLGIFPGAFQNDPAPYDIGSTLRGLIFRYIAEDNLDIVLELVLSGVLQRQISRQLVQFVLTWVTEEVEDRGYVPGPDQHKTAMMNKMVVDKESLAVGKEEKPKKWDYQNKHEEIWGENFHTNAVAGMTARIIARDWDKLDTRERGYNLNDRSYRRDLARLGEILSSLSNYDLKKSAILLKELSGSPVLTDCERVTRDIIKFFRQQRTPDGDFGYWTKEQIKFTNSGGSADSFQENLVNPISELCQEALDEIEPNQDN